MFSEIENLKITTITKGTSKLPGGTTNRKRHALILRTGGTVRYDFDTYSLTAEPGTLLFLPQGSAYNATQIFKEACTYTAVNFEADLKDAKPGTYTLENFTEADAFENSLPELWKYGGQFEHYKCYAMFYELLAYLQNTENLNYSDKKKMHIIAPAVEYLKKHLYDANLRTDTLHTHCGISGTYFRKIFMTNFGTSPQNYVQNKRLAHAKSVLDSGNFITIAEVAESVGYTDPFYFSRVFKKKYGEPPSKYANNS